MPSKCEGLGLLQAPPILTNEFNLAMVLLFWNGPREALSSRVFYFWNRRLQPIEDEL